MAEQRDDIEIVEEGGSDNTKLLIVVIAVLLLAVVGLGAVMLMGGSEEEDAATDTSQQQATTRQAPIYYTLEPAFVVNFSEQSKGAVKYMQVKMKVMARDQQVIDAIKRHQPALQHELLMLLYSQKYDDLLNSEGTKALQQASIDTINRVIKSEEPLENDLQAVYFTSFIMQ